MFRSYTEKLFRPDLKAESPSSSQIKWFACDICVDNEHIDNNWRTETDVELHRKEAHSKIIFDQMKLHLERFCTVCMTLQESAEDLLTHIKTRHLYSSPESPRVEREIFICNYCKSIFFNRDVLEVHIQYMHLGTVQERNKGTFVCPKCKKTCMLRTLWFHMQYHEIPSMSVCDICLLLCANTTDLETHLKSHPLYYKCDICNYQTTKEYAFKNHLTQHGETIEEAMKRNHFREIFHRMPGPQVFKYNIHHVIKGLVLPCNISICTLCREICTSKNEMYNHACRTHGSRRAPPPTSFSCACGARFASRVLYKHHTFKMGGACVKEEENTQEKPAVVLNESLSENAKPDQQDWEIGFEVEVHQNEASQGDEEMEQEAADDDDEQLVYIYAAIDEGELVTVEEDNGQIISF